MLDDQILAVSGQYAVLTRGNFIKEAGQLQGLARYVTIDKFLAEQFHCKLAAFETLNDGMHGTG